MLLYILLMIGVVALDQISKFLVLKYLVPVGSYPLWQDVLHFTYVENTGAAFGMLKEHRWVFLVISSVAIVLILLYMWKARPKDKLELVALSFIVGGGIGNMIDRVWRGFVVDFIDVTCIRFYVFNLADSFVCIGCGMMILWLILTEVRERRAVKAAKAADGHDA